MSSRGMPVTQQMRQERRTRAEARQVEYDKLSLQEKLKRLPPEPAAAKQRARLQGLLEKKNQPKQEPTVDQGEPQAAGPDPATTVATAESPKAKQTKKYMKGTK